MSSAITSLTGSSTSSGSGLDVGSVVDQLIYTEQAPERLLKQQQSSLNAQATALRDMNNRLESLESSINALKDLSGAFASRIAQSSNTAILTASATSAAASGNHTITVSQLATVASQYSDPLASPTATFTPGSLQFSIGGGDLQTITFDASHNTLATAADYINSLGLGVSASVVTDAVGSRLTLVSKTSGAVGDLTVAAAPTGLGFHVGTAGQNAKLTVDGVPVQSATNQVQGILAGVTLTLTGTSGEVPISLSVSPDTAKTRTAIDNMISAYNSLIGNISAQFTFNQSTNSAGTLAGSSSLRSIQSSLLSTISFQLGQPNSYITLRSLGIEMQDDGTLKLDEAKITAALKDKPGDVQKFFQGTSANGFANVFSAQLAKLTDSIDGPLLVDARGIDDSSKAISDQIEQFEVRIAQRRQTLTDQYTRIDTMLRQLPLLQQQISAQLGSLK